MNAFEIVRNHSDDEVVEIHKSLLAYKEIPLAAKLRTEFIRAKLFWSTRFDWAGAIKYFIEEENKEMTDENPMEYYVDASDKNAYLSEIHGFLQAKLGKENIQEVTMKDLYEHVTDEELYVERTFFERRAVRALLAIYADSFPHNSFITLHNNIKGRTKRLEAISAIYSEETISSLQVVADTLNEQPALLEEVEEKDSSFTRDLMLVLHLYFHNEGSREQALDYLSKAINLTADSNSIHYSLLFYRQEMYSQQGD